MSRNLSLILGGATACTFMVASFIPLWVGSLTFTSFLLFFGSLVTYYNNHLDGWPLWSPSSPHGLGCRTLTLLRPDGCPPFHRIPTGCIWSHCDDIPIPNLLRNRLPSHCTYVGCHSIEVTADRDTLQPWLYPAEISTTRIRARGSAVSAFSNWMSTFIIVEITPIGTTT